MIRKVIFALVGAALLAFVVGLGYLASIDSRYVVWFGLAAAILVRLAFVLFGKAFQTDDRELMAKLSKVPEIRELMEKAESEEERIRILELERKTLDETIRTEARRQMLIETQMRLETELQEKIKGYDATLRELEFLNEEIEATPIRAEIKRVQRRLKERKRGRVIVIRLGKRELAFAVRDLRENPLGLLLLIVLSAIERLQRRANPTEVKK